MSVTSRSLILSTILIVCAFVLYRLSTNTVKTSDNDSLDQYPTFTAINFDADSYNEDGLLTYSFKSDNVVYYKKQDLLNFSNPLGIYYDHKNTGIEPWQITADFGTMILNKNVELDGNVVVVPLFTDAPITEFTTGYMHFDIVKNIITAPGKVNIKGTNFTNTGSNLTGNLTTKECTISGDPHAHYIP